MIPNLGATRPWKYVHTHAVAVLFQSVFFFIVALIGPQPCPSLRTCPMRPRWTPLSAPKPFGAVAFHALVSIRSASGLAIEAVQESRLITSTRSPTTGFFNGRQRTATTTTRVEENTVKRTRSSYRIPLVSTDGFTGSASSMGLHSGSPTRGSVKLGRSFPSGREFGLKIMFVDFRYIASHAATCGSSPWTTSPFGSSTLAKREHWQRRAADSLVSRTCALKRGNGTLS